MLRRWTYAFLICTACVLLSIYVFDRAVADYAHRIGLSILKRDALRIPVMQAVALSLLLWGGLRNSDSESGRLQALIALRAGFAMVCGMALNRFILKPAFGREVPWLYFAHHQYGFQPFHSSELFGSFPSGHAVLAAALITILWTAYPRWRFCYAAAMVLLSSGLILGEWHFLSDLIAGVFVGVSAGMTSNALFDSLAARDMLGSQGVHFVDRQMVKLLASAGAAGQPTDDIPAVVRDGRMPQ